MTLRWSGSCFVIAGLAASAAAAQEPTGSPTNATATVSPATVADAAMRADEPESAGASRFGLSLGTALATGNFGSSQGSRLFSTALGARASLGTLRLTASIPYLRVRSRGLIFSGIDSTPVIAAGGTPGPRVTRDGWGDITLGGAYTIPTREGGTEVELSGRVKLPTARNRDQISTGKTDYSVGAQVTQPVGRFAPFASVTYRIFGDPRTLNLKNGFAASAGTSIAIGDGSRSVVLLSYHYARKATRLVRDSHELFAGASTRLGSSRLRATGFTTAGISRGAAAVSGGVSLAFDF